VVCKFFSLTLESAYFGLVLADGFVDLSFGGVLFLWNFSTGLEVLEISFVLKHLLAAWARKLKDFKDVFHVPMQFYGI